MYLFYQPYTDKTELDADESRHCAKVLRKNVGDEILVVDGQGKHHRSVLTEVGKKCNYQVLETKEFEQPTPIHIAIAPTKNLDRTEWFIEKATEIGATHISLLSTANSERTRLNPERLARKAVSAFKQSKGAYLPQINDVRPLKQFISEVEFGQKFIAYVDEAERKHLFNAVQANTPTIILIGPEGDFSPQEIKLAFEHNYTAVSLGTSRLRTETAGIVATQIIKLKQEI